MVDSLVSRSHLMTHGTMYLKVRGRIRSGDFLYIFTAFQRAIIRGVPHLSTRGADFSLAASTPDVRASLFDVDEFAAYQTGAVVGMRTPDAKFEMLFLPKPFGRLVKMCLGGSDRYRLVCEVPWQHVGRVSNQP